MSDTPLRLLEEHISKHARRLARSHCEEGCMMLEKSIVKLGGLSHCLVQTRNSAVSITISEMVSLIEGYCIDWHERRFVRLMMERIAEQQASLVAPNQDQTES